LNTFAKVGLELLRATNAQPDEPIVLFEKAAPIIVEQRTIGLEIILDALPGTPVLLLEGYDFFEKGQAQQRRFPTLPREHDFASVLSLNVLPNVCFQHFVGHPRTRIEQLLLGKVIAVSAVQIAQSPNGFHDHVIAADIASRDRRRT
jgi:hypothetical protein